MNEMQHNVEGQVVAAEPVTGNEIVEGSSNGSAHQFAASPLDLPAELFRAGLDRRKENRGALMEWVRAALIEGIDFGCIKTKRGPSNPACGSQVPRRYAACWVSPFISRHSRIMSRRR